MHIIPSIDLQEGRCVRLLQGDFDRQTTYCQNPRDIARNFQNMGLTFLHIVDLDGARQGQQRNDLVVREIAEQCQFSIQLGGGIRESATIERWLHSGVSRCVVGSVAVIDPAAVKSWIEEFGATRIVLALDVHLGDDNMPMLATHGWTRTSDVVLWDCIDTFTDDGLTQILCTDISRDGAMVGPNIDLYREILRRYPEIGLQASGGIRHAADLRVLSKIGVDAAITGRALLDGRISTEEIASFLPAA